MAEFDYYDTEAAHLDEMANYDGLLITDVSISPNNFNRGDKVIIQIRKGQL